jgi:RNA polymerase sigma-70 factor (ECF subfamily)
MSSSDDIAIFSEGCAAHDLTFTSVFDKSYAGLVFFSNNLIGDRQEAEDVVQNAFVSYWNCKDEVGREPSIVKSFLYTTVRNACMDLLRHRKVVQKFRNQLDDDPIEESFVENEMIRAEVLSEIFNAIELLPSGCRQVLKMSYFEGKRNQEISDDLGVSINTVKTQKQRALQLLRLKLSSTALVLLLLQLLR